MRSIRWLILASIIPVLGSCVRDEPSEIVVRLRVPEKSRASADTVECFALNVSGPGLPPMILPTAPAGCFHTELGLVSPVVPRPEAGGSSVVTLRMRVPSGPNRRLQVLGLYTGGGPAACKKRLEDYFTADAPKVFVHEFGSTNQPVNMFRDQVVAIYNSFGATDLAHDCAAGTGGGAPTNTVSLPLAYVYKGTADGTGFDPLFIDAPGALPPSYTGVYPMNLDTAAVAVINAGTGFVFSQNLTQTYFGRLDLLFDTAGFDLNTYSSLKLTMTASQGGFQTFAPLSGGCTGVLGTAVPAPPYFYVQAAVMLSDGRPEWLPLPVPADSLSPKDYIINFPAPPITYAFQEYTLGKFIHLTVRSRDSARLSIACTAIQLGKVQVELVP